MTPASGIVRMNIAAMETGDLVLLRGAMTVGLAVELDPDKRAEAYEIIDLVNAELKSRMRPDEVTSGG